MVSSLISFLRSQVFVSISNMKGLYLAFLVFMLGIKQSLEVNLEAVNTAAANVTEGSDTGSGIESEHDDDHAFEYIISTTTNGALDKSVIDKILQYFNETCLTSGDVFSHLNVSVSSNLTEEQLIKVAPYIVFHLSKGLPCNVSAKFGTFNFNTVCRSHISTIINVMVTYGKFASKPDAEKCFSAVTLLDEDCTSSQSEINLTLMKMIAAMIRGDCILPEPDYFVAELEEYLKVSKGKIDMESFANLMTKLNIGGKSSVEEEDHDHEDEAVIDNTEVGNRHKRSAEDEEQSGENVKCYSTTDLLNIFQVDKNNFNFKSFTSMCPALIQQIISGSCKTSEVTTSPASTKDPNYTTAMKYGYGTASVLVISLLAFGGLLLFPQIGSNGYKMTMQFFIALGVGTLSGDALLHIIPEIVGLHKHEDGADAEHAHEEEGKEEDEKLYIWRILVVIGGIYLFYLFENVLRLWNVLRGSNITFHVHDDEDGSHHHSPTHTHNHDSGTNHGQNHMTSALTIPNNNCRCDDDDNDEEKNNEVLTSKTTQHLTEKHAEKQTVCCGITTIGIMVLVGDVLHNFGDGIALGVAFSSSWVGGLGASIAIFCHELPHEFGDFAIYMKNGMSKWKALGFNFMAACFAFIGLYIGLSIAENPEAREWMLAVIAGMFLYIALVDVLHEMIEERTSFPVLQFVIQNVGMCLGWAILLLLALYEDRIKSALES